MQQYRIVLLIAVAIGAVTAVQAAPAPPPASEAYPPEPTLPPAPLPVTVDLPCRPPLGTPLRFRHESVRDMSQGDQPLWRFKLQTDESFTFVSHDTAGSVVKMMIERADWQAPSRGIEPPSAALMLVDVPIMIRLDAAHRPVTILNWPAVRAAYVRGAEAKAVRGKALIEAMPPERRAAADKALVHNLQQLRVMSVEAGTREISQDMVDLFGLCGARLLPMRPTPMSKAYDWVSPEVPVVAKGNLNITVLDRDAGLLVADTVMGTDAGELARSVQATLARLLKGRGAETVPVRVIESVGAVEQVSVRESQHAEIDLATGLPRLMSFSSEIAGPALQRKVFSQFKRLP